MPWSPTVNVVENWGDLRVIVGGVTDVTWFRDVPVQIESYVLSDPYGHGPAQLRWPAVTPFDVPGEGDVAWLKPKTVVEIYRADATTGAVIGVPIWAGLIASLDVDQSGWSVQCNGMFSGFLEWQVHTPSVTSYYVDCGYLLASSLKLFSNPWTFSPYNGQILGYGTSKRGNRNMTRLEWIDTVLELCTAADGTEYTILPSTTIPRRFEFQARDLTTVDWTLSNSAPGVVPQLTRDASSEVNRIHGEGVTPPSDPNLGGSRWGGKKFPNLGEETAPAFPGTLTVGSTGESIFFMLYEMLSDGGITQADYDAAHVGGNQGVGGTWTFTAAASDAVAQMQRRAGLPVTGDVDATTWATVWADGEDSQNLGAAHYAPISLDDTTEPWLYSNNGSVIGVNPTFDPTNMWIQRFVNFGDSMTKADAIRLADAEIARCSVPRYYGTLTLTSDPQEGHRLDIRPGDNVQLNGFAGDAVLHVSGVSVSGSSPVTVTLTVDTAGRPLPIVLAQTQLARARYSDPAFLLSKSKANNTQDAMIGWDAEAGAGMIPRRALQGDQWNILRVVGADAGLLRRLDFTVTPAREYVVAIFGRQVTPARVSALKASNPLSTSYDPTDDDQVGLDAYEFVEGWGDGNSPCGYWPKQKGDTGATLNGRFRDDGNWSFYSRVPPWLWVAIYPSGDCTITGRIWQQLVEGE